MLCIGGTKNGDCRVCRISNSPRVAELALYPTATISMSFTPYKRVRCSTSRAVVSGYFGFDSDMQEYVIRLCTLYTDS
jgi:hypothetical protein